MDIVALLTTTPLVGVVPYITFIITLATAILLLLPAPTTASSSVYQVIYGVVHFTASLKKAPAPAAPTPPTA